jgi:Arc/MetJ-type ribon-helix-helix transcriptional regulator
MRSRLDRWCNAQKDRPSRSEAIRRLVEKALAAEPPSPRARTKGANKAVKMAAAAIDDMTDKSQPAEEQQRRKRRLIKGPSEFRDLRKK